ncbi:hypothetical protein ACFYMO_28885 [Streptomyces sp. NPDC007025]|uniref:hypothetical protein n=1 Tax=Streptomyces sp. NPDC007025 TaxID=3364771 RepID=UPI003699C6B6
MASRTGGRDAELRGELGCGVHRAGAQPAGDQRGTQGLRDVVADAEPSGTVGSFSGRSAVMGALLLGVRGRA